ncbi:MAG: lipoyl synthase [Spirochaetota bacterium]
MNPLKKKPRTKGYEKAPEKPDWLKVRLRFPMQDDPVELVRQDLDKKNLHTVCESASCPNLNHCWSRKAATFMLNGDICTRRCAYCDVASGRPARLDPKEPQKIADSVQRLGLRHAVLTAVNRDDLADGGAGQFHDTVLAIRAVQPKCKVEVLIPDFKGKPENLAIIYAAKPDIINHNIETVRSLFPVVAKQKKYDLSLQVLQHIAESGFVCKSGLILGLGETVTEAKECISDLANHGVQMLTVGQYLQPTPTHHPVQEYIRPEVFEELKWYALDRGFIHVESGALVRSSYHAEKQADPIFSDTEK